MNSQEQLEAWIESREQTLLRKMVDEALCACPEEQAQDLRTLVLETAQLRRYEHGGVYVAVKIDRDWVPLDRAVKILATRLKMGV